MRLIIVSTNDRYEVAGVPLRRWMGHDDQGRSCDVMVHGIGTKDAGLQAVADRELDPGGELIPTRLGCVGCEGRDAAWQKAIGEGLDRLAAFLHGSVWGDGVCLNHDQIVDVVAKVFSGEGSVDKL